MSVRGKGASRALYFGERKGRNDMNNALEEMLEQTSEQIGCSAVGCQEVDVCIPVTIKPFGEAGNVTTKCVGEPMVSAGWDSQMGEHVDVCKFTICQKLRVEVPVIFGARAEVGETSVDCGYVESFSTDCEEEAAEE